MKISNNKYRWLIEISLIILVIFAVRFWTQRDMISGIAPNINVAMLSGQQFELYQDKRRPILIHFWATWCPVCKFEQTSIENISKKQPVITIAMQSGDNTELKSFMQQEKLSFNVINDTQGVLSQKYNVRGVPASFIINKDNNIEFVEVGYTSEIGLRIRLWWAGL